MIARSLRSPECFGAVFDRHAPAIYRYIARRLGPDGANDLVAETFLVSKPWPRGRQHWPSRDTITPVDLATGATLPPMTVTASVHGWGTLAIAPGGRAAYFLDTQRGAVTPINLVTHTVGKPIASGEGSFTMLFGQGASIGYLIETGRVLALNTATNATLPPIKLPADVIDWGEAVRR